MAFGFLITSDFIGDSDDNDNGHADGGLSPDEIRAHPKKEKFFLYDDDGTKYYEGLFVGDDDASGFEPLDFFGLPNAGCTEIRYRSPNTGRFETL